LKTCCCGIAPKHVKRYLRELSEHLADLTQAQREAGFDTEDAATRARAALGQDQELADAMLKQRDFRSISARFPWLVFGVMPPLVVIAAFFLLLPLMIIMGHLGGAIGRDNKLVLPVPVWFDWSMTALVFAANLLIGTALAFLLARMAKNQRMKLVWPLAGMALILFLGVRGSFHAGKGGISFNLSTLLVSYRGFGSAVFPYHWPIFLAQTALLCLPLAWLIRHGHKTKAAA
jgi:hypothetical protein